MKERNLYEDEIQNLTCPGWMENVFLLHYQAPGSGMSPVNHWKNFDFIALTNIWVLNLRLESSLNFHPKSPSHLRMLLFRTAVRKNWCSKWAVERSANKWPFIQQMASSLCHKPQLFRNLSLFFPASAGVCQSLQTLCSVYSVPSQIFLRKC